MFQMPSWGPSLDHVLSKPYFILTYCCKVAIIGENYIFANIHEFDIS